MILGVSHFAVRSSNIESDYDILSTQGWYAEYVDHNVAVQPCERPFLTDQHPPQQSIMFLRHTSGCPALELVSPVVCTDVMHRTQLVLPDESGLGSLTGTISVPNLDQGIALFTKSLGFVSEGSPQAGQAMLSLNRPLKQWSTTIILKEEADELTPTPTMDCYGWFALGLLSSDLENDALAVATQCKNSITKPFELRVGGKIWNVVLCILDYGFAIELMQVKNI